MTIVTADLAMSLDGYIAGRNVTRDDPIGDHGEQLHGWFAGLASWRARQGLEGGEDNVDSQIIGEWFDATGAVVMGRTMYDLGETPWGDDPPFKTPVFVLTHRPRPVVHKDGGTSFTFVGDGIVEAVASARAVAGDRNVDIAGGADTVRQAIEAEVLDQLQIHVVPVLLGGGVRLFDDGGRFRELTPVRVVNGIGAVHLTYRLRD